MLTSDETISESLARSPGLTVWLTGLPGSGKTTTARVLRAHYEYGGRPFVMLDGDELRSGLNCDLGFSNRERDESVRRTGEIALVLAQQGSIVVTSLVSPRRCSRNAVRARHEAAGIRFLEVHIAASLEVCEQRDPKGLYQKSRAGLVAQMTGVDDPYEAPINPDLVLATGDLDIEATTDHLIEVVDEALRHGVERCPRFEGDVLRANISMENVVSNRVN